MTNPIVEINLKNTVVLQRKGIITSAGDEYYITYFLSLGMGENYALFREILNEFGKD